METYVADIDQLLEDTVEIAENEQCYSIGFIEIDHLLENTRDW
ncbi:hypothetical protein [Bacillus sp. T33-2]|nr:hypothetical protein [Bacillus sp. T33-2]